jgi:hypothetical protein
LDQRWSEYVSDRREFVAAFPRLDGPQYTQAETKLVAYLPAKTGAQFKCWTERTEILCRLHGTDNPVAVVLDLLRDNQVQEAVQMIIDQNLAKGFRQDSHVYLPDEAETPLDREFAPFTGESTREKRLIVLKEDGLRVRLLRLDRGENYIIDVS